ncbi:MAG TPA: hypothetical protein VIM58_07705 [Candidatus Methylacidiphilales bacterium]
MNAPAPSDPEAWNRAHARVLAYLGAFGLADRLRTARLALEIVDEAKARPPGASPTEAAMGIARERVARWLSGNLGGEGTDAAYAEGCLALLLSGVPETAPEAFLVPDPGESVRTALRTPLVVVGPDLEVSSMTPRRIDYGPIQNLAHQTWQRWDPKEVAAALLLWASVFFVLHHWIPLWL